MSHPIYSQVYTAVARTLLRFDRHCNADPWYSPEWHRLITRIAIYESRGFTRTVQFGLTPGIIADMWLDMIRPKPATAEAIGLTVGDRGPWEPIRVMEHLPLAIIHCRLKFDDWGAGTPGMSLEDHALYWRGQYLGITRGGKTLAGEFAQLVHDFEAAHPDPRLTLSSDEHRQISTAPGAKQIGLRL